MNKKNSDNKEIFQALSLITQIGVTMSITIIMCLFFGKWLDGVFSTAPIFLLIFIVLGVLAAFRNLFKITRRFYIGKDNTHLDENNNKEDEANNDK